MDRPFQRPSLLAIVAVCGLVLQATGAVVVVRRWQVDPSGEALGPPIAVLAGLIALCAGAMTSARALGRLGWPTKLAAWASITLVASALPAAGLVAPLQALTTGLGALGLALAIPAWVRRRSGNSDGPGTFELAGVGLVVTGLTAGVAYGVWRLAGAVGGSASTVTDAAFMDPAPFDLWLWIHRAIDLLLGVRGGALVFAPLLLPALLVAARRADRMARSMLLATAAAAGVLAAAVGPHFLGKPAMLGGQLGALLAPLLFWAAWGQLRPATVPVDRVGFANRATTSLTLVWVLGLVVGGSAFWSRVAPLEPGLALELGSGPAPRANSAASAAPSLLDRGVFAWLPYETTAAPTAADRELTSDPNTIVRLLAGDRAAPSRARLLVASHGPEWPLRVLLGTQAKAKRLKGLRLHVDDWAVARTYPVPLHPAGVRTLKNLQQAPAWRQHPLPIPAVESARVKTEDKTAWSVRVVSVSTSLPGDATDLSLGVRVLGNAPSQQAAIAAASPGLALPESAPAGVESTVIVPLHNLGTLTWEPDGPVPVALGYRFYPEPIGVSAVRDGPRVPFAAAIAPGEQSEQPLRVLWPERPGRYWMVIDLALERIAWFEEYGRPPLAQGWVEVVGEEPAVPIAVDAPRPRVRVRR